MNFPDVRIKDKISFIVPIYNHERYIADFIAAFSDQELNSIDFELILIDDCSQDDSFELASNALANLNRDSKILRNKINLGVCKTLNNGIKLSRGEFIMPIASDDLIVPEILVKRIAYMIDHPECEISIGDCDQIDEQGNTIVSGYLKTLLKAREVDVSNRTECIKALLRYWGLPGGLNIYRKTVYEKLGLYDETLEHEDWEFFLRTCQKCNIKFDMLVANKYRIHASNLHKRRRFKATVEHLKTSIHYLQKFKWFRRQLIYRIVMLSIVSVLIGLRIR